MVNYLVFESKDVDYILIMVLNRNDLLQVQEEFVKKKYIIWDTESYCDGFIIRASKNTFDEEEK